MKYLLLIHSNPITWSHPSFLHTEEGRALPKKARDALAQQLTDLLAGLRESGELITAVPLEPPARTRVVRVREGIRATTDGPYSEAKEQLAGVFLIDVATAERADEIAATIPEAQFFAVEVRQVSEFD
ncbi:YciI family protein [Kribbella turkmenica]|uniref:YciI family protein n=1 Tax=Kribbella turkmenica TaxID=2530375 RepID=A0A4R4WP30_9ACTN|nr:YciI family protein [Kribbella turkmenica]TDD17935.1 YciI family protein [Kribbella turkmenica]